MEKVEHLDQRTKQVLSALESRAAYNQKLDNSLSDLEETIERLTDRNGALAQQLSKSHDENHRLSNDNRKFSNNAEQYAAERDEIAMELEQAKDEVRQLSELLASLVPAVEKITATATDDDRLSRVVGLVTKAQATQSADDETLSVVEPTEVDSTQAATTESVGREDTAVADDAKDTDSKPESNVESIESFNPRESVKEAKGSRRNRNWRAAL